MWCLCELGFVQMNAVWLVMSLPPAGCDTFSRRVLSSSEEAFILMGILMICVRTWLVGLTSQFDLGPVLSLQTYQVIADPGSCQKNILLAWALWHSTFVSKVSGLPLAHLPLHTSPFLKAVWQVDQVKAKYKILSLKAAPKQWRSEPPLNFFPVLQNSS